MGGNPYLLTSVADLGEPPLFWGKFNSHTCSFKQINLLKWKITSELASFLINSLILVGNFYYNITVLAALCLTIISLVTTVLFYSSFNCFLNKWLCQFRRWVLHALLIIPHRIMLRQSIDENAKPDRPMKNVLDFIPLVIHRQNEVDKELRTSQGIQIQKEQMYSWKGSVLQSTRTQVGEVLYLWWSSSIAIRISSNDLL